MNVLCGYAIRVLILALASCPLVGMLDHDRVVSEWQADRICEGRPASGYDIMQRRKAEREQAATAPTPR